MLISRITFLENNDLTDQLLESERKQEVLVGILKEVTANCEHCKWEVSKRLSKVTGHIEAVIINE